MPGSQPPGVVSPIASIRDFAARDSGASASTCKSLRSGSRSIATSRIASFVVTVSPDGPVNCWPWTAMYSRSVKISSAV